MMKIKLFGTLVFLFLLGACGSTSDESRSILPEISIVSPSDTLSQQMPIPVEVLVSDNNGLLYTEIRLQKPGDTLYYENTFSLSGQSKKIAFEIDTPLGQRMLGEHLIEILCVDEDGNRALRDTSFFLR